MTTHIAEPPPALIDWWVWGVRNAAGIVGEVLLAARGVALLLILSKAAVYVTTDDPLALRDLGLAVGGLAGSWGIGILLRRFAGERDTRDPARWLFRHRK
jgi:hypothetical protein